MTPADPSLLAQLRQLRVQLRKDEAHAFSRMNAAPHMAEYWRGMRDQAGDAAVSLTAILEGQPPETATTPLAYDRIVDNSPSGKYVEPRPTRLAPLITIKQQIIDAAVVYSDSPEPGGGEVLVMFLLTELDAQRQASASVRREAIDECIALVHAHKGAELKCEYVERLEALRDRPRVSPRPPSGGGQ